MKTKKQPLFYRVFSLFVALTMCFPQGAAIPAAFAQIAEVKLPILSAIEQFPQDLGTVKKLSLPQSAKKPFLIYIQDIHAQPDAQSHILAILDWFQSQNQKGRKMVVAMESARGDLHPEYLDFSKQYPQIGESVAAALREKGELTGAELFAWEQYQKNPDYGKYFEFAGVENTDLYSENLSLYRGRLVQSAEIKSALKPLRAYLEKTKSKIFSKELNNFFTERDRRKEGDFGEGLDSAPALTAYFRYLSKLSKDVLKIDLAKPVEQLRYPSLARALKLDALYPELKSPQAELEFKALLSELEKKARQKEEKQEVAALKNIAASAVPRRVLENVWKWAPSRGVDYIRYPAFAKWAAFLILKSEIKADELHREMNSLEEQLLNRMIRNPREKELAGIVYRFTALESYLNLTLMRSEWDRYKADLSVLSPSMMEASLRRLNGSKKGVAVTALEAFVKDSRRFYETAEARDRVILENALKIQGGKDVLRVLVAGGFHTEGLLAQFDEKKIGYAVIQPRVNHIEKHGSEKVFLDQNADISSYFKAGSLTKQEALFFKEFFEAGLMPLMKEGKLEYKEAARIAARIINSHPVLSSVWDASFQPGKQSSILELNPSRRTEAPNQAVGDTALLANKKFYSQARAKISREAVPAAFRLASRIQVLNPSALPARSEVRSVMSDIEAELDMSGAALVAMGKHLTGEMNAALNGDESSSLPAILSLVGMPTGQEEGDYVTGDVGGTNARISQVRLADRTISILKAKKFRIPDSVLRAPAAELFAFLAGKFLRFAAGISASLKTAVRYLVGVTFSYPFELRGNLRNAVVTNLTKKLQSPDLVGKNIGELLQGGFDAAPPFLSMSLEAVINDGVATALAASYVRPETTSVAGIWGTGHNGISAVIVSKIKKLQAVFERHPELRKKFADNDKMWIVWESAFYAVPEIYRTDVDRELDASYNPGKQIFEKMTSGLYLGEITRLYLNRLVSANELFGGHMQPVLLKNSITTAEAYYVRGTDLKITWLGKLLYLIFPPLARFLFYKNILTTEDMSVISGDETEDLSVTEKTLRKLGVGGSTLEDRRKVKKIADLVARRAARMNAMEMLFLVLFGDENLNQKHDVAYDGTVFEHYPGVKQEMKAALREMAWAMYQFDGRVIADIDKKIDFILTRNGSATGPAIAAAMQKRSEVRNKSAVSDALLDQNFRSVTVHASQVHAAAFFFPQLNPGFRFFQSRDVPGKLGEVELVFTSRSSGSMPAVSLNADIFQRSELRRNLSVGSIYAAGPYEVRLLTIHENDVDLRISGGTLKKTEWPEHVPFHIPYKINGDVEIQIAPKSETSVEIETLSPVRSEMRIVTDLNDLPEVLRLMINDIRSKTDSEDMGIRISFKYGSVQIELKYDRIDYRREDESLAQILEGAMASLKSMTAAEKAPKESRYRVTATRVTANTAGLDRSYRVDVVVELESKRNLAMDPAVRAEGSKLKIGNDEIEAAQFRDKGFIEYGIQYSYIHGQIVLHREYRRTLTKEEYAKRDKRTEFFSEMFELPVKIRQKKDGSFKVYAIVNGKNTLLYGNDLPSRFTDEAARILTDNRVKDVISQPGTSGIATYTRTLEAAFHVGDGARTIARAVRRVLPFTPRVKSALEFKLLTGDDLRWLDTHLTRAQIDRYMRDRKRSEVRALSVEDRIRTVVAEQLGIRTAEEVPEDIASLNPEVPDIVDLQMELEDEFGIFVNEKWLDDRLTVTAIADYVRQHLRSEVRQLALKKGDTIEYPSTKSVFEVLEDYTQGVYVAVAPKFPNKPADKLQSRWLEYAHLDDLFQRGQLTLNGEFAAEEILARSEMRSPKKSDDKPLDMDAIMQALEGKAAAPPSVAPDDFELALEPLENESTPKPNSGAGPAKLIDAELEETPALTPEESKINEIREGLRSSSFIAIANNLRAAEAIAKAGEDSKKSLFIAFAPPNQSYATAELEKAVKSLSELKSRYPNLVIGVIAIMHSEVNAAIEAGAQFILNLAPKEDALKLAASKGVFTSVNVYGKTNADIAAAIKNGANALSVATKDIEGARRAFPKTDLIPSGGITPEAALGILDNKTVLAIALGSGLGNTKKLIDGSIKSLIETAALRSEVRSPKKREKRKLEAVDLVFNVVVGTGQRLNANWEAIPLDMKKNDTLKNFRLFLDRASKSVDPFFKTWLDGVVEGFKSYDWERTYYAPELIVYTEPRPGNQVYVGMVGFGIRHKNSGRFFVIGINNMFKPHDMEDFLTVKMVHTPGMIANYDSGSDFAYFDDVAELDMFSPKKGEVILALTYKKRSEMRQVEKEIVERYLSVLKADARFAKGFRVISVSPDLETGVYPANITTIYIEPADSSAVQGEGRLKDLRGISYDSLFASMPQTNASVQMPDLSHVTAAHPQNEAKRVYAILLSVPGSGKRSEVRMDMSAGGEGWSEYGHYKNAAVPVTLSSTGEIPQIDSLTNKNIPVLIANAHKFAVENKDRRIPKEELIELAKANRFIVTGMQFTDNGDGTFTIKSQLNQFTAPNENILDQSLLGDLVDELEKINAGIRAQNRATGQGDQGILQMIVPGQGGSTATGNVFRKLGIVPEMYVWDHTDPAAYNAMLLAVTGMEPYRPGMDFDVWKHELAQRFKQVLPNILLVPTAFGMTSEEAVINFAVLYFVAEELGLADDFKSHVQALTPPGSSVAQAMEARGFGDQRLSVQMNRLPGYIPGRGTAPAATPLALYPRYFHDRIAGKTKEQALAGLRDWNERANLSPETLKAFQTLAVLMDRYVRQGKNKFTLVLPPQWSAFEEWFKQIFEESEGVDRKLIYNTLLGRTVEGDARGGEPEYKIITNEQNLDPKNYRAPANSDRVFLVVNVKGLPLSQEQQSNLSALRNAGHPVITLNLSDTEALPTLMQGLHNTVAALVGYLWERNFVTQPSVDAYKAEAKIMIVEAMVAGGFLPNVEAANNPNTYFNALIRWMLRPDQTVAAIEESKTYQALRGQTPQSKFVTENGKIGLYFNEQITSPEAVAAQVQKQGGDVQSAPDVIAAIIQLEMKKRDLHSLSPMAEIAHGGDLDHSQAGLEMGKLLEDTATALFRHPFLVPVDMTSVPKHLHSTHEAIRNQPGLTLLFMPEEYDAPFLGRYPADYIKAQVMAAKSALEKVGRTVVLVTYPRNDMKGRRLIADLTSKVQKIVAPNEYGIVKPEGRKRWYGEFLVRNLEAEKIALARIGNEDAVEVDAVSNPSTLIQRKTNALIPKQESFTYLLTSEGMLVIEPGELDRARMENFAKRSELRELNPSQPAVDFAPRGSLDFNVTGPTEVFRRSVSIASAGDFETDAKAQVFKKLPQAVVIDAVAQLFAASYYDVSEAQKILGVQGALRLLQLALAADKATPLALKVQAVAKSALTPQEYDFMFASGGPAIQLLSKLEGAEVPEYANLIFTISAHHPDDQYTFFYEGSSAGVETARRRLLARARLFSPELMNQMTVVPVSQKDLLSAVRRSIAGNDAQSRGVVMNSRAFLEKLGYTKASRLFNDLNHEAALVLAAALLRNQFPEGDMNVKQISQELSKRGIEVKTFIANLETLLRNTATLSVQA